MPKISVIIPIYKVERYIERCARSLFEQTLAEIEFIFVNDCTPDSSIEILRNVLSEYPNRQLQTTIIDMPHNIGLPKVRFEGLQRASGDYIIYCDSDDWVEPTMYEKLLSKALLDNNDVVICGYSKYQRNKKVVIHDISYKHSKTIKQAIISDEINNYVWNKLIKRELFRNVEQWPVNNMLEDAAILIPIIFYCSTIGVVPEPLYNYNCQNSNSLISQKSTPEKVYQMVDNTNIVCGFLNRRDESKQYLSDILHRKCLVKIASSVLPRKEYLEIYPEINFYIISDPRVPLSGKLGHITKLLGIHGISSFFRRPKCDVVVL